MPGHGQHDDGTTYHSAVPTSTADRAARVRFRRALALMAMTLVLPGSAQLACGNRRVGRAALRIWFALLIVAAGCLLVAARAPRVRVLAGLRPGGAADGPVRADGAGDRLGGAVLRRLAARAAADAADGPPPGGGRASTGSCASRSPRCCSSARTWSACSATSSRPCSAPATRRGAHDGRYNVLLLGGDSGVGPLGAAARLDHRRQHRRRDRPDRAGLAAAQHAELPLRQGAR